MNDPNALDFVRGTRAIIAYPDLGRRGAIDSDARLEEARGLALAIGISVKASHAFRIRTARPATLFGGGQVDIIAASLEDEDAELLIVDGSLSAIQQRNLEERLKVKVIDRTGLILEIFGERAATAEGRLQVELAHLDYQAGRLVRSWTHLERQRGGFGFLGGPGETQIEADRRLIRDRMAKLRRELEQVKRTRGLHRERRQKAPWPVVALVGYTNAGKSTLFNSLTHADVMAEDLLFATLDPTMRAIRLDGVEKVILSDTVGFVSDLPTELVAAFRATLEEVLSADLVIHVRDMAHPDAQMQGESVEAILTDLGLEFDPVLAGQGLAVPMIEAWNKWDIIDEDTRAHLLETAPDDRTICPISALTGEGVPALLRLASNALVISHRVHKVHLARHDGQRIAWLHAHGEVLDSREQGDDVWLSVRLSDKDWGRFSAL